MVRGGAIVGATGTAAARGFFNLICLGEGGARGALGVVLQARLLAQGNVMHQFGAAAPLPFFLPLPDLGLLRGTDGPGKGGPVAGPHPLRLFHTVQGARSAASPVLSTSATGSGWTTAAEQPQRVFICLSLDERVAVGGERK